MRRFFVYAIWGVIGWCTLWAMEKLFDRAISEHANTKASQVASHDIDAQLVFVGPSRVENMLDPTVVERITGKKSYNLGKNAASIEEQIIYTKLYLSYNKKPELIVLEASPYYFETNKRFQKAYWELIPFLNQPAISDYVKEAEPRIYYLSYFPFMKYTFNNTQTTKEALRGIGKLVKGSPRVFNPHLSYNLLDVKWDNTFELFKKEHPNGLSYVLDTSVMRTYHSFLSFLKKENIPVVLYEAPMLNEGKALILNRKQCLQKLDSLFQLTQTPYEYALSDTLAICKDRTYFYNSTHTNKQGSLISSEYIGKWLKDYTSK